MYILRPIIYLFLIFIWTLPAHSMRRSFSHYNKQAETLDEQIYKTRMSHFLIKNPEARKYYRIVAGSEEKDLEDWHEQKIKDDRTQTVKKFLKPIADSTDVKMGISFGSASISVNTSDVVKSYVKSFTKDEEPDIDLENIERVAAYWAVELIACENNPITCEINALSWKRMAYLDGKKRFKDFPRIKHSTGRTLTTNEQMKESPELASVFTLITQQGTDQKISQMAAISKKQHAESIQKMEEKVKNIKGNQDLIKLEKIASKDSKLHQLQKDREFLLDLKEGEDSKESSQYPLEQIDMYLKDNETSIKSHLWNKDMETAEVIMTTAVVAIQMFPNVPKEVIKAGKAGRVALSMVKIGGYMAIAGVNPMSMLAMASEASALVGIISDAPTSDEIIAGQFQKIMEGQVKTLKMVYKLDFKIDGLRKQLDLIIGVLEKNHDEVMSQFTSIQGRLDTIINNIELLGDNIKEGQQESGAEFIYDGDSFVLFWDTFGLDLNRQASRCKELKRKHEKTGVIIHHDLFVQCMGSGQHWLSQLLSELSKMRSKSKRFSESGTYMEAQTVEDLRKSDEGQILSSLSGPVDKRLEMFYAFFNWLKEWLEVNDLKSYQKISQQEHWIAYEDLLYDAMGDKTHVQIPNIKYFENAFDVYTELMTNLPTPENYDYFSQENINGEYVHNLKNQCEYIHTFDQITEYNRQIFDIAYGIHYILFFIIKDKIKENYNEYLEYRETYYYDLINKKKEEYGKKKDSVKLRHVISNIDSKYEDENKNKYAGLETGILKIIYDKKYTLYDFLSLEGKKLEEFVAEASGVIDEYDMKTLGFEKKDEGHVVCNDFKGREYIEGTIKKEEEVKILKNTFESFINGSSKQGTCVFTDKYGLISGETGQRITLYQKNGFDHKGHIYYELVCPVFVTDTDDLYFLWFDWSEPKKRAICLEAELSFLYDRDLFYKDEPGSQQIYYRKESDNTEPIPVMIEEYAHRLISITPDELKDELTIENKKTLRQFSEGINKIHPYLIIKILTWEHASLGQWNISSSMKIDIESNREGMGAAHWFYNVAKNRDSFGECYKYACLEVLPQYVADKKVWSDRAQKEIRETQDLLLNNIKNDILSSAYDKNANKSNTLFGDFAISGLILDTVAKVSYGRNNLIGSAGGKEGSDAALYKIINGFSSLINGNNNKNQSQLQGGSALRNLKDFLKYKVEGFKLSDIKVSRSQDFGNPKVRQNALLRINLIGYSVPNQCLLKEA